MKGRIAGLAVIAVTMAASVLTVHELWPLPAGTASSVAGRVTPVSLPAVGVAAVPVCPGPQSLIVPAGAQRTEPGGPVVVGAAVEFAPRAAAVSVAPRPATLSGLALRDGGDGFAVHALRRTSSGLVTMQVPKSSDTPAMSAVQVTLNRSGDGRGLAALACPPTATQTWLVGGGTQTGRRGQLVLANPAGTPAQADVTVYGPKGIVRAQAGTGVTVPAHGVRALRIDALAPALDAVAVLVQARSGRVSATLRDTYVRGLTPSGADDVTAAAPAARRQIVPGMAVATPDRTALPHDPGAPGAIAVRVVNPGTGDVIARVRLLGEDGPVELDGGVLTLAAGQVRDVAVTGVPDGAYAALVEADAPVVAGAVLGRAAGGRAADFGWATSVEPLSGTAVTALPELIENGARVTTGRQLLITAPSGAGSIEVVELDGEGRRLAVDTVQVAASSSTRHSVSAMASAVRLHLLDGSSPLVAAVVLHLPDPSGAMISVLPVRPGPAGDGGRPYAVSDVRVGLR